MRPLYFTLLMTCLAAASVGCKTLDMPKYPWTSEARKRARETRETPVRMAALWTDAAIAVPGKPAMRGFGGRVYFYNDQGQAIPVKGKFAIYAFDDSQQDHATREPEKKFAFTDEQLALHLSQSPLGPSYSIWIPWDTAGGEQREISLLPVFTTSTGHAVVGEQSVNVLPGKAAAPGR